MSVDEQTLLDQLQRAEEAAQANRIEFAEECFLRVYDQTLDSRSPAELRACRDLVVLYSREQRVFESLLFARRLARLAELMGDAFQHAFALMSVGGVLKDAEDWEELEPALVAIAGVAASVPEEDGFRLRRNVAGMRAEAAIQAGNLDSAAADIDQVRASIERYGAIPAEMLWLHSLDALRALARERFEEVIAHVAKARGLEVPQAIGGLDLELLELQALAGLGDREGALGIVRNSLELLRGPDMHGKAQRIRFCSELGPILVEKLDAPTEAAIVYELASEAVLGRIMELERCVREQEGVGGILDEDRRLLRRFRQRFKRKHSQFLREVVQLGQCAAEAPFDSHRKDGLIVLCAWCECVRAQNGTWLPLGQFVPQGIDKSVTHTICPACKGNPEG